MPPQLRAGVLGARDQWGIGDWKCPLWKTCACSLADQGCERPHRRVGVLIGLGCRGTTEVERYLLEWVPLQVVGGRR